MKNPADLKNILWSLETTIESVKLKYRMTCKVKLKLVIN